MGKHLESKDDKKGKKNSTQINKDKVNNQNNNASLNKNSKSNKQTHKNIGKKENKSYDGISANTKDVINEDIENFSTENEINIGDNENRKKCKKKNRKVLKIILTILTILIIICGVIFGKYIYNAGGSISGAVMDMVKDVLGDQDPIFVLVMGVSEDISAELTDTIMLIGYNPDTNQAFVLSIPRDTFVGTNENTASGYDKINALYQTDPQKTVEAVEKLTGINIDYYVTVKNSALVEIVDAIGGVEFDVPIDMNYDDNSQDLHIHLQAGTQILSGDQAEQLVRFRHNNDGTSYSTEYGDNDLGRMRTQREFLKAVAEQVINWNNVDKIKEIATAVFDNLETDITLSKILTYIPYAAEFNVDNLSMDQLPGQSEILNELWFFKVDEEETEELINSYIEQLGLTEEEKVKYLITDTTTTTTTNKTNNTTTNTNKTTNTTNSLKTTTNTTTNTTTSTNKTENNTNSSTINNNTTANVVKSDNTTSNEIKNESNETIDNTNSVNEITNNTTNTIGNKSDTNSVTNNTNNTNNTTNSSTVSDTTKSTENTE